MGNDSRLDKIYPGTQRRVRIEVGEEVDTPISLRSGTIIFRPGMLIDNEHILRLAQEHNIYLIER